MVRGILFVLSTCALVSCANAPTTPNQRPATYGQPGAGYAPPATAGYPAAPRQGPAPWPTAVSPQPAGPRVDLLAFRRELEQRCASKPGAPGYQGGPVSCGGQPDSFTGCVAEQAEPLIRTSTSRLAQANVDGGPSKYYSSDVGLLQVQLCELEANQRFIDWAKGYDSFSPQVQAAHDAAQCTCRARTLMRLYLVGQAVARGVAADDLARVIREAGDQGRLQNRELRAIQGRSNQLKTSPPPEPPEGAGPINLDQAIENSTLAEQTVGRLALGLCTSYRGLDVALGGAAGCPDLVKLYYLSAVCLTWPGDYACVQPGRSGP